MNKNKLAGIVRLHQPEVKAPGKGREKSGDDTTQISAHVSTDLYKDVKKKLIDADLTLTDLLTDLLKKWVEG